MTSLQSLYTVASCSKALGKAQGENSMQLCVHNSICKLTLLREWSASATGLCHLLESGPRDDKAFGLLGAWLGVDVVNWCFLDLTFRNQHGQVATIIIRIRSTIATCCYTTRTYWIAAEVGVCHFAYSKNYYKLQKSPSRNHAYSSNSEDQHF